jgi:hypothetical protein
MADDVKINEIIISDLDNLNNRQFGFETTNDTDLGWKMAGGKNADGELTRFLGKDKAAQVTTLVATGSVTITSGSITTDSLSLSTLSSYKILYGDFNQATTFKWEDSKLRIGSTNTPEYLCDIESTTQNNLRVLNSNANAESPLFVLEKSSASPADDDGCGKIVFRSTNDDSSVPEVDYCTIECFSSDVSSDRSDAELKISMHLAGSEVEYFTLKGGAIKIPYLGAAPSTLENGMLWVESDGLHIYYNDAEKTVAGV